jgi:Mycobacterium membrane protein
MNTKVITVVAFVAVAIMTPTVSSAGVQKPFPVTLQRMNSDIQSDVNSRTNSYEVKGEHTSCDYVENRMRDGYRFKCATYNGSDREIAHELITVTDPRGRYWTWHYEFAPYVPQRLTGAKATYIVTGAPGTKADITVNDVAGSINKLDVTLPYKVTEIGGIAASLTAMDLSLSKTASITCEIEEPHVAVYKRTSTGPNAFVTCA